MQLAVPCEPLLFLPYCDVIFDLLLSRHMALWNRFVISNINIWLILGHRDPFEVLWHSTSFYCHVCAQNRFPFHCLRVWKSVSTESFQCNLYEYQRQSNHITSHHFFVSFGSKPFCCSLPLNPPTNVIPYVSHISAICIRLHILVMMMMSLSSPVQWSLRRGPLSSFLQEVLRIWFSWMNLRV